MADFLNKNGDMPNGGGKFTSIKVNRILRDPFYCGRLTTIQYRDSYIRADGTKYAVDQIKYCCYYKSRKLYPCDGQTIYQADRVDEMIRQIIRKIFSCMDGTPEEEKIQATFRRQMAGNRVAQKKLDRELTKDKERLTKLQLEIGKTLKTGESSYCADDLSQAIRTIKARIGEAKYSIKKDGYVSLWLFVFIKR